MTPVYETKIQGLALIRTLDVSLHQGGGDSLVPSVATALRSTLRRHLTIRILS
jgi:hypothetical protein